MSEKGKNTFLVAVVEARMDAEKHTLLEDQLRAAMEATRFHRLIRDADEQFLAAITSVALMHSNEPPVYNRIMLEVKSIKLLDKLFGGDSSVMQELVDINANHEPLGLMKMWKEVSNNGQR